MKTESLAILMVIHKWVERTEHSDIFKFRNENNSRVVGLVDSVGTIIADEVVEESEIDILWDSNNLAIGFRNYTSGEYKIYLRVIEKKQIKYKCIHRSSKYEMTSILKNAIVLLDTDNNYSTIALDGKRHNKVNYLNIVEVVNKQELLGVRFLTVESGTRAVVRKVDILDSIGKVKESSVKDSKYIENRFGITINKLYSRGIHSIEKKRNGITCINGREVW